MSLTEQNARSKLRQAVHRGKYEKPSVCGNCDSEPKNKRGLVAIFPLGTDRWMEPDWICSTCNERRLEAKRGGKRFIPRTPRMEYPPELTYEKIKEHLFADCMTYQMIAERYELSSTALLCKRFKMEAVAREEWPFPELRRRYNKSRKEIIEHRVATGLLVLPETPPVNSRMIRTAGLQHDLRELMTMIHMPFNEFDRLAGVRHDTAASVVRGGSPYLSASVADRLSRAHARLARTYADYPARAELMRTQLRAALKDGTRRGAHGVGAEIGCSYTLINRFLKGRSLDWYLFLPLEALVAQWTAQDREIQDLRDRMRHCFAVSPPSSTGSNRWPSRNRRSLARLAGLTVSEVERFDYYEFPCHPYLHAIRQVVETWEQEDGVLAHAS